MPNLKTGLVATSHMENEQRVALHPRHLDRLPLEVRENLYFEEGYGERFRLSDDWLAERCGGLLSRAQILETCDVVVLVKPMEEDLWAMKEGAVLWAFCNCVQQEGITQAAIERRLTLVGFEAMYHWGRDDKREQVVLQKNSEAAGYCAVLHGLPMRGFDGHYGPSKSAVILGFGSVGRGAVYGLQGLGIHDITVYTQRPPHVVRDQLPGCQYRRMVRGEPMLAEELDGQTRPLLEALAEHDILINASVQNPLKPLMYLQSEDEVKKLRNGSLIVDVSCDLGMGFPFARPTTFDDPTFWVDEVLYYAVDHTPSYLWEAVSWEISQALLPYLPTVMEGPGALEKDMVLDRAVQLLAGKIRNPVILEFQGREGDYPYPKNV